MPRRLLASVVVVAIVVAAGCGGGGGGQASTRPSASVTPEEVVRGWLEAVNTGDRAAGQRLATPEFMAADAAAADGWFANVLEVRATGIGTPRSARGTVSAGKFAEAVYVPLTMNLRQRRATSFRDGEQPWGFVVARNANSGRWRISEQGLG